MLLIEFSYMPRQLLSRCLKVVISYPISVIIDRHGPESDARAGLNVLNVRDRIALLGPSSGGKWSRVSITVKLYTGVGAVGPISDMYNTFINDGHN